MGDRPRTRHLSFRSRNSGQLFVQFLPRVLDFDTPVGLDDLYLQFRFYWVRFWESLELRNVHVFEQWMSLRSAIELSRPIVFGGGLIAELTPVPSASSVDKTIARIAQRRLTFWE
jgi:hypothetical protein